ncbi:BIG1-domain-containing protein [Coniochaeta hoffmannii]|uniref:Protein BIG1 n=1 Tax=Coniochaeta hoffmannii TaxID=91930 RepID=A0AA38VRC6_9PEZI|nr:BIG1-domain-containing protein [Coniochaeta hoffmannii]
MRFSIASVLLSSTAAYAFSDTSPFVLLSTSKLDTPPSPPQLQSSKSLTNSLTSLLSSCPTTRYALVSQPNLHAADIRDESDGGKCHMPNLCRAASSAVSAYTVAEVVGQLGSPSLSSIINTACASAGKAVEVTEIELRHLPALRTGLGEKEVDERRGILADNDYELDRLLSTLGDDYTVLLFSDPNEFKAYEPSFVEPMRTDLKRRGEAEPVYVGRRAGNATDNRGLFERYQFFTPGIFMGLIAAFAMLSILYVGLQGLSSLEVSYGAFDKEMGPAAQKKQL